MSYSHRVAYYFQPLKNSTTRGYTGMMSVNINTRFNQWNLITNSNGWVGIQDLFLIEYTEIKEDGLSLIGTPLVHTWSFDDEEAVSYRYQIHMNELNDTLNENEYRQLIGTLISLDCYYRNPDRPITQVSWSVHTTVDVHEIDQSDTQILTVPYLGESSVTDVEIPIFIPRSTG